MSEKVAVQNYNANSEAIYKSLYFQTRVDRAYPAYRLLHGDLSALDLDQFRAEVARLVALFFHPDYQDLEQTANSGGIQVVADPHRGWTVVLHGPTVYRMPLTMEATIKESK